MASRQQIADYLSRNLTDPRQRKMAVRAAAAWLRSNNKTRQARYLAHDVALTLMKRGYVTVRITTARIMNPDIKSRVENYIKRLTGAKQLELILQVDSSLIGGVVIETPDAVLDASIRTKLAKYVEGVIH